MPTTQTDAQMIATQRRLLLEMYRIITHNTVDIRNQTIARAKNTLVKELKLHLGVDDDE